MTNRLSANFEATLSSMVQANNRLRKSADDLMDLANGKTPAAQLYGIAIMNHATGDIVYVRGFRGEHEEMAEVCDDITCFLSDPEQEAVLLPPGHSMNR